MGQLFPLLAGLALTGAGAGMNMAAANKVKKRQEGIINEEIARQRANMNQANAAFQSNLNRTGPAQDVAAQEKGTNERIAFANQVMGSETDPTKEPLLRDSSVIQPGSDFDRQRQARFRTAGLSEMDLRNMIRTLDTNQMLDVISHNARRSSEILPAELQEASMAGDQLANIGGLMSGAGSMLGMYGAMRPVKPPVATTMPSTVYRGASLLGGAAPIKGFEDYLLSATPLMNVQRSPQRF